MKTVKRIIAMLMALAMVAALVACGGGKTDAGNDNTDYLGTADSKQVALFGDLTGTKLRVAGSVDMQDWEKNFFTQLEEETGMTIEIENMESNELATKISQAVASGDKRNYFDVGICANSTILNNIYANIALPIDDYIYYDDPVWKYSDAADFNCLDLYRLDDHFWGVPSHGYHENFIFYNKTYFEEMQAPDPYTEYYLKDNWTFETFMDTCEKVTKKAADGSVEVAAWASWNYFSFLAAAGNNMIEQDPDTTTWKIVFDKPNGIAGLDLLYQCSKNGWLNSSTSGYSEFVNRKVAMLIDKPSSAMGTATDAYARMSDEIGMIPFPKMNKEQAKYVCPMTVSGYYIPACAQNEKGAAAYLYYHRIAEQQRDKSEWGKQNLLRFLNEEATERRDEYIAKCDFAVPFVDGLAGWYNENRTQFLEIMWKGTAPASAVDQMKPLLNDSLRRTVG